MGKVKGFKGFDKEMKCQSMPGKTRAKTLGERILALHCRHAKECEWVSDVEVVNLILAAVIEATPNITTIDFGYGYEGKLRREGALKFAEEFGKILEGK